MSIADVGPTPVQARPGRPIIGLVLGSGAARPSFSTIMIEAFNIMQDRLTRMRLAGDPPDVHIAPQVGHIGWLEFHRATEAIEAGRIAAERALDPIVETIAALGALG